MTDISSPPPAVARRRVSLALRRAREAKQWTQTQVANAMEWSLSKVMRIEKGQVNISSTDLRAVLRVLDVTDTTEIDELLADARVSRNERYTTDTEDREHFTPAMLQLFQYEEAATEILVYHNVVIPGHLQIEPYARAIFDGWGTFEPSTVDARLRQRMHRKKVLFRRPRPAYQAILDESVLKRPFGGTAVMAEQLSEMLRVITELDLRVRILPLSAASVVATIGPFTIMSLGDTGEPMIYRETGDRDEILQAAQEAERHLEIFGRISDAALDDGESRSLLKAYISDYLADRAMSG